MPSTSSQISQGKCSKQLGERRRGNGNIDRTSQQIHRHVQRKTCTLHQERHGGARPRRGRPISDWGDAGMERPRGTQVPNRKHGSSSSGRRRTPPHGQGNLGSSRGIAHLSKGCSRRPGGHGDGRGRRIQQTCRPGSILEPLTRRRAVRGGHRPAHAVKRRGNGGRWGEAGSTVSRGGGAGPRAARWAVGRRRGHGWLGGRRRGARTPAQSRELSLFVFNYQRLKLASVTFQVDVANYVRVNTAHHMISDPVI